jgi:O-antigen/teichoic acid export membrane protein
MVNPIIISLATVLLPGISRSIANQDKEILNQQMDSSFAFITLLGIPVSAGLLVFAPEFLQVFTGPQYRDAVPAMQITAGLAFIIGLGNIFGLQLLVPGGFRKQYMVSTLFGVVISLGLNILLIRTLRETGAAIAMIAAETAVTVVSFYFVRKLIPIHFNWNLILQSVLICLLFLPVAWLVRMWDTTFVIRLITEVILCATLYFAFQILILRERHLIELLHRQWR